MSEKQHDTPKANILVVDDTPHNLKVLMNILTEHGYEVGLAPNGHLALRAIQASPPDLILLDIKMPDMDGYQVCEKVKTDPATRDIPVIFISALYDVPDKIKGFAVGGVDYITKPFQLEEVLARVQTHLTIRRLQQQLQEENARFQALSNAAFEGILIHDHGQLVDANHIIETMFGYSHAEAIRRRVVDFIRAEYRDTVLTSIRQGNGHPYEVIGVRQDGSSFPLEIQVKTMSYQGSDVSIVALRDLSWQKAMEAENQQLQQENRTLKATMQDRYKLGEIIGRSPVMQEAYELVIKAAATDAPVVIYGESGTGKDLIAQTIHRLSKRKGKAFVPVNCGSIQETLFESEFFGHRKGSFTGALRDKPGFFDAAHQGTLFLDEIGELPMPMQVKLLRAIEGKGYTPVGDQAVKHADVRIIAATNRNLKEHVKQGEMREDFFYRINVITITVPPLRDRREDIPLLIEHFLKQSKDANTPAVLPGKIMEALYYRDWPGNIRQLQNVLQRYLTLQRLDFNDDIHDGATTAAREFSGLQPEGGLREALEAYEKQVILNTLQQNRGHRGKTAKILQLPPRTLRRKLWKYRIKEIP